MSNGIDRVGTKYPLSFFSLKLLWWIVFFKEHKSITQTQIINSSRSRTLRLTLLLRTALLCRGAPHFHNNSKRGQSGHSLQITNSKCLITFKILLFSNCKLYFSKGVVNHYRAHHVVHWYLIDMNPPIISF